MLLTDCKLEAHAVVSSPVMRTQPDERWRDVFEKEIIPGSLYKLYCSADFLSFGKSPGFLADSKNILFGYFGMLMKGLLEFFNESKDLNDEFEKWHSLQWDPKKAILGKPFDKEADSKERRVFRHLMVSLSGLLDAFADLVALFFAGRIPGLSVGKSDFSKIEKWIGKRLPSIQLLVTPYDHYLHRLHDELQPIMKTTGHDVEWLKMLNLFRNKSAHLGDKMFPILAFEGIDGHFYHFLSREWPYIIEEHLQIAPKSKDPNASQQMIDHCKKALMHEDIQSFISNLRKRVYDLMSKAFEILNEAYQHLKSFPVNTQALTDLQNNLQVYKFEHF